MGVEAAGALAVALLLGGFADRIYLMRPRTRRRASAAAATIRRVLPAWCEVWAGPRSQIEDYARAAWIGGYESALLDHTLLGESTKRRVPESQRRQAHEWAVRAYARSCGEREEVGDDGR